MNVSNAAKALLDRLGADSSRTPLFEFNAEVEALRFALDEEEAAARKFREQFIGTGQVISNPDVNCEVFY